MKARKLLHEVKVLSHYDSLKSEPSHAHLFSRLSHTSQNPRNAQDRFWCYCLLPRLASMIQTCGFRYWTNNKRSQVLAVITFLKSDGQVIIAGTVRETFY